MNKRSEEIYDEATQNPIPKEIPERDDKMHPWEQKLYLQILHLQKSLSVRERLDLAWLLMELGTSINNRTQRLHPDWESLPHPNRETRDRNQ